MLDELREHQRSINRVMRCAVAVVLLRFILLSVDEVVPFGAELGELLSDAGLAFATAWLFQWLVVIRPEGVREVTNSKVIAPLLDDLIRPGKQLVYHLRLTAHTGEESWPPDRDEIVRACKKVDATKPPRGRLEDDWVQFLRYLQGRRMQAERALEPYYHRMDGELLGLLGSERDAGAMLRAFEPDWAAFKHVSIVPWATDFNEWLESLEKIRTYREAYAPGVETDFEAK